MDSLTAGGGGPLETAVRLLSASLSWVILSWSVATLGGEEVVVRNSSSCSVATLTSCSSRSVKLGGPVSGGELHNGGVLLVHLPHTQSFSFSFLMKGLNKFDYLTNVICKCKYHFFIWSGQTVPVWRPVRGAAVPPCWQ